MGFTFNFTVEKLPLLALILSVTITILTFVMFSFLITEELHNSHILETENTIQKILSSLNSYETSLLGVKGLFASSEVVTLEEWNTFLEIQQLISKHPGLLEIGFMKKIQGEQQLTELIKIMNNYGIDEFQIRPEGIREQYFPVIFIHPMNSENYKFLGYDGYSETIRHNTIDQSISSKHVALSAPINLIKTDGHTKGFLLDIPIYVTNFDNFDGIVYSVFDMNDLIFKIFDKNSFEHHSIIIYDSEFPDTVLFNSTQYVSITVPTNTSIEIQKSLKFGDREWIFDVIHYDVKTPAQNNALTLMLVVGFILSGLVFATFSYYAKNLKTAKKTQIQKDEFAAMTSHELKTPLVPIQGYCEMLLDPGLLGELNQKQRQSVEKILFNSEKLQSLINKILTAQRLDMGKQNWKFDTKNVNEFMGGVYQDNLSLMTEKNIKFINSSNVDDEFVSDMSQLSEVFTNIIQNAVDFVPVNGEIEISAKEDLGKIEFFVRDNGVGIPIDKQKHLFKKFYQADTSITRKHGGTGLGLTICKGIVEGLGGKIWLKSELGKGTTLFFYVPKMGKNKSL